MTTNASRPNLTSIAAACILSGGLITAAIIDSHKTVAVAPAGVTGAVSVAGVTPPIGQDAAREQFESQIAAQSFNPIYKHATNTEFAFKGVKVTQTTYSAKDDTLSFSYNTHWETVGGDKMTCIEGATLVNDGYGHYCNPVRMNDEDSETQFANVSIK